MPTLARRKTLVLAAFVAVPTGARAIAETFFPNVAAYVPPYMLLFLLLGTAANVLLAWRPEMVVKWLDMGMAHNPLNEKELRSAKMGATIGVVVTLVMVFYWVRSWP